MSYCTFKNIILRKPGVVTEAERHVIKENLNSRDTINLRIMFAQLSYRDRNKVEQAEYEIIREIVRSRNF